MKTNVGQLLVDTSKQQSYELDFRIKKILITKVSGDSEEDMDAKITSNAFEGMLIPSSHTSSFGRQDFAEIPGGIYAEHSERIKINVEVDSDLPAKLCILYEIL